MGSATARHATPCTAARNVTTYSKTPPGRLLQPRRSGPEPTTNGFMAVMHGPETKTILGHVWWRTGTRSSGGSIRESRQAGTGSCPRVHVLTAVSHKHDVGAQAPVAPVALVRLGGELVVTEGRLEKLELARKWRRVSPHRAGARDGGGSTTSGPGATIAYSLQVRSCIPAAA